MTVPISHRSYIMRSCIVSHRTFERHWPFVHKHCKTLWEKQGETDIVSVGEDDERPLGQVVHEPAAIERIICLWVPVTVQCLQSLTGLKEIALYTKADDEVEMYAQKAGIRIYYHVSKGFWGPSVAECGLALTLCALRRIPYHYNAMIQSKETWDYSYGTGADGLLRGPQLCDDLRFTNGTVEGKKVRIIGVGNVGSRYAAFMKALGADVAAWDPFAGDPCFHRAGARKVFYLEQLLEDADIFAPLIPAGAGQNEGIVTAEHINTLPRGCLIVMVTRAAMCDCGAIRKRVLADEIALAADVFDYEPLELDDRLVGRHNVVHTPHIAGRTLDANKRFAEMLAAQFAPVEWS